MNELVQEVETKIRAASGGISSAAALKRKEIYNTALRVYGLNLPGLRDINKKGFSFYGREESLVLEIWDRIWRSSDCFEVKIQPLLYYEQKAKILEPELYWPVLSGWAAGLDNWEHSDRLSKIYSFFMEKKPALIYPVLKGWNGDSEPWLRRQSLVGLICYAQIHEKHPSLTRVFPLVRKLLDDPDIYVQKGLGWTLREAYNIDSVKTSAFIEKHLLKLTPVAFTAALEKAPQKVREKLKKRRKLHRAEIQKVQKT